MYWQIRSSKSRQRLQQLREQAGHMTASDFCAVREVFSCQGGGHPHMERREVIRLLIGGAPAALLLTRFPRTSLAQDGADWVTAFPREPFHVAAWPAGRKVAVSFALFVEEFGFGQGPVLRPDLANRNPDLVNEAFRQTRSIGASPASAACSRSWMSLSASC